MSVRAKFIVNSTTHFNGGGVKVEMRPVTGGSEENARFFSYTPAGVIEITIKNEVASNQFEPGKTFYVDFTEVD